MPFLWQVLLLIAECLCLLDIQTASGLKLTNRRITKREVFADLGSRTVAEVLETPTSLDENYGNWGEWSEPKFCPEEMWARGAEQMVEQDQGGGDDTGINNVRLTCAPLGSQDEHFQYAEPHLRRQMSGGWGGISYCSNSVVVGFQQRSESFGGSDKDDSDANSLRIVCASRHVRDLPNGRPVGRWSAQQKCPKGSAVCGIAVQAWIPTGSGTKGDSGDDTGVSNVRMYCCFMGVAGNCTATDRWEILVGDIRNDAALPYKHTYTKTTGRTSTLKKDTKQSQEQMRSAAITAEVGVQYKFLSAKLSTTLEMSGKTGFDWTKASSKTFKSTTEESIELEVSSGKCSRIEQVVGQCGTDVVYTPKTRIVDCTAKVVKP